MYSFEGKFRTTPNVSLGGKRKQDKIDKAKLLLKAQQERQKREDLRRRLRSATLIQSSVRSFLCRQHLKGKLRRHFDSNRPNTSSKDCDIDRLFYLSSRLKFFYDSQMDNERLVWFGQQMLKNKAAWVRKDGSTLFHTSGILKSACKCLSFLDSTSSFYAIPLRILETFTDRDFLKTAMRWSDSDADIFVLLLWKRLLKLDFFKSIIHFISIKIPPCMESLDGSIPPPTPLAKSLISLLIRPVLATVSNEPPNDGNMDLSDIFVLQNQVIDSFNREVFLPRPTETLYHNVYPILGGMTQFPVERFLGCVLYSIDRDPRPQLWILGSLAKIIHPNLESMATEGFCNYMRCLRYLLLRLPSVKPSKSDFDSDSDDTDDEDENMETEESNFKALSNRDYGFINDGHSVVKSQLFLNAIVDRNLYESNATLDALCAICYQMIAERKADVQRNRLLRTLAFSSSFLRKLWTSLTTAHTKSVVTGDNVLAINQLVNGSPMSSEDASLIRSKVIVFCSLLNLHLLAVPDKDFYSDMPALTTFSKSTLQSVAMLLRDICVSTIKRALPDSMLNKQEINSVIKALSDGRAIQLEELHETKDINEYILLFNVCRRLVKHLHTRDSRIAFIPKGGWFSTSINIMQSKKQSPGWLGRQMNDIVALYLTEAASEDAKLTINEARQIAVAVNIPFVIPFAHRVSLFTTMLSIDRNAVVDERQEVLIDAGFAHPPRSHEISVRRDRIYEDAFNDLSQDNAPDLRKRLRVRFVNHAGADEAGYGAGVTREFLQQVVKSGFNPARGLFQTTAEGLLYPSPHASSITENSNEHFFFLGRLVGKVLFEGMQAELPFASFFLCKILQRNSSDVDINHLQSLDPDFYKNLMYLHDYAGEVSDLNLNFTVVDETLGVAKETELIRDGKNIPVTNKNKDLYIHLMSNYKLNVQMREPCYHFRRGLEDVIRIERLQLFDHEELRILIAGSEVPIDIMDLKANTTYSSGYSADHPTIKAFWEVLPELTNDQLSLLMRFVTSCSRPPLLGFKELQPPFCIQRGGTEDRLPTASTCMNLLKLPEYPDAETLKAKLLYCLESGSGFELS